MTNIELFAYSGQHKEQILDLAYLDNSAPVIPKTKKGRNILVANNARLLQLISSFCFLVKHRKHRKQIDDPDVKKLINEVIDILTKTPEINLSPFSQFFMVYDSSYASFIEYPTDEQRKFIYEMLRRYGERRHKLYLCHGYTNSMLQVVNDNYSHKRKSMASLKKVSRILESAGFVHSSTIGANQRCYFLPDKGNKEEYLEFVQQHDVIMKYTKNKQGKLPDMLFFNHGEYYIAELKHINGSGGGQDKQVSEIIDFIKYPERNNHIHYVSFLDGQYSNLLHDEEKRKRKNCKIRTQYRNILTHLKNNPGHYFLNTAGLKMLVHQLVYEME